MTRWINVLYRGGKVAVELVEIDDEGHELEAAAAVAWRAMRLAADLESIILKARTAFRSFEFQKELYDKYIRFREYTERVALWEKEGRQGDEPERVQFAALANKPGTSTHEIGNAVDVAGATQADSPICLWLDANARKYGWRRTVPSELWHYNWSP